MVWATNTVSLHVMWMSAVVIWPAAVGVKGGKEITGSTVTRAVPCIKKYSAEDLTTLHLACDHYTDWLSDMLRIDHSQNTRLALHAPKLARRHYYY